jgi:hypothetical protein
LFLPRAYVSDNKNKLFEKIGNFSVCAVSMSFLIFFRVIR